MLALSSPATRFVTFKQLAINQRSVEAASGATGVPEQASGWLQSRHHPRRTHQPPFNIRLTRSNYSTAQPVERSWPSRSNATSARPDPGPQYVQPSDAYPPRERAAVRPDPPPSVHLLCDPRYIRWGSSV
ncbi:hypothetical protein C8Q76DRAFT_16515 [Earliella scabrosa]|nr:hypothetical protein C8Q76DRAFT_16515 [Earliella scabrosa]